jgi:hypothetical protein
MSAGRLNKFSVEQDILAAKRAVHRLEFFVSENRRRIFSHGWEL